MIYNKDFELSEEQLKKYNDWIEKHAKDHGDEDVMFSASIRFSFSPFGRTVIAVIPGSGLILDLE